MTPLRIGAVAVPGFMAAALSSHRVELGVWAFLVQSAGTRILFDGGLANDIEITQAHVRVALGAEYGYIDADSAAVQAALADVNVRPEDIDLAVVSHLHHDHAGAIDWLPRAKIWVHAREFDTLASPFAVVVAPDWQITPGTRRRLDVLRSTDRLVIWDDRSVALADAVELVLVGGHTRGSVALLGRVRPDWRVGLLGDLILTEAHLLRGAIPTTALDAYETIRSTSYMLDAADELWPGHATAGPVLSVAAASSWPPATAWLNA